MPQSPPKVTPEEFASHNWNLIRCGDKVRIITEPLAGVHDTVWIAKLYTPQRIRGQGYAREAMERLCEAADETSMILRLWVHSEGPMTNLQLIDFYESLGFEIVETNYVKMVRYPNP